MKEIFFVGDFSSNTGPAIANQTFKKELRKDKSYFFSNQTSIIPRIMEMIFKTILSKKICLCSYSKLNILSIKIAKLMNKKIFYLMHGSKSIEKLIASDNFKGDIIKAPVELEPIEEYFLENSEKVFCVSKKFQELMKIKFPEYCEKFEYIYNTVNFNNKNNKILKPSEKYIQILTIGGGMKQKNVLKICEAIEIINKSSSKKIKLIVVGQNSEKMNQILKYDFVVYYKNLKHEKLLKIMQLSDVYIQNSYFETFGIAILESVILGCDVLISQYVGAIDIFEDINSSDIIYDVDNSTEIAQKILHLIDNPNNRRIEQNINYDAIDLKKNVYKMIQLISKN